jgi:hypothetical protein
MTMTKKHFIALADTIRNANWYAHNDNTQGFSQDAIERLADFCQWQNSNFNRERWLGYIAGTNGPSGGTVKS